MSETAPDSAEGTGTTEPDAAGLWAEASDPDVTDSIADSRLPAADHDPLPDAQVSDPNSTPQGPTS